MLLKSGGAILCAHSVITRELPAAGEAHVALESFKAFLRLARRIGEIVPLGELVDRHARGQSTTGLIALTFDDAYAALYSELKAVVSREMVPISIFVVTQAAAVGARYWWDRIEDLFPRVSPDRWQAFERACGLPEEYRRGQPREYGPLRPLRQWLLARFAGRWPSQLEPALAALEQETGYRTVHRSMTFEELRDLAATPGIEIGVHTVSHPVLPLLSDETLEHEVAASHDALREKFEKVLPVLAIPFGLYDERTLRLARSAGMKFSLTLAGTSINGSAHPQALPRFCLTRNDTAVKLGLRVLGLPALLRRCSHARPSAYPDLPSPTT